MKISPEWLRDFVEFKSDERQLARELTMCGIAVEGITGEGRDTLYEVEFTTNRPDAMNHYGVAREISAIKDADLKPLKPKLARVVPAEPPAARVVIEDAEGCARYTARVIRNVTVGASPEHIVKRLESVEQRSINNAADATNYALWEIGHPTHVFDLDLLDGATIIVRRARDGETLKTLDGVERKLTSEDLVIADAKKPVALAGVMGGEDSKVTERTKNILVESAWFDPVTIRKMAKRHGMHTDASHRFERGADWGITPTAAARVCELILESAGGEVVGDAIDAVARTIERPTVQLRRSEVLRHLGKDIAETEVARILRRLGFKLTPGRTTVSTKATPPTAGIGGAHAAVAEEPAEYAVEIPTWRLDVEREIDLIEEIARIHGYDNFENTLPAFAGAVIELPDAAKAEKIRTALLSLGYNEAMSPTFVARTDAERFSNVQPVEIANPLSEEAAFMRTSLLPNMLDMLARNLNYGTQNVRLFDSGNVYEKVGERTEEHQRLVIGATGTAQRASVHEPTRAYGFFDLKGDLETVLGAFEYRSLYFDVNTSEYFHPGRSARVVMDGATLAQFGQIHPDAAAQRKLKQEVYVAEVLLDRLYGHKLREPKYRPVPRFPAVDRDFSFIFGNEVTFAAIQEAVGRLPIPEMRALYPVETFRGGTIPSGKYSLLLRAEFQSTERTLRDEEVAQWAKQVIAVLEKLGGTQRA